MEKIVGGRNWLIDGSVEDELVYGMGEGLGVSFSN